MSDAPHAGAKPERRRHPRAIIDFSAVLQAGPRAYPARVLNLSMGGALLDIGARSPDPSIKVGDPVSVEITYGSIAGPLHLEASAVLWNSSTGRVPLLAIQFRDVPAAESDVLEQMMTEALVQIRGRATARTLAQPSRAGTKRGG